MNEAAALDDAIDDIGAGRRIVWAEGAGLEAAAMDFQSEREGGTSEAYDPILIHPATPLDGNVSPIGVVHDSRAELELSDRTTRLVMDSDLDILPFRQAQYGFFAAAREARRGPTEEPLTVASMEYETGSRSRLKRKAAAHVYIDRVPIGTAVRLLPGEKVGAGHGTPVRIENDAVNA